MELKITKAAESSPGDSFLVTNVIDCPGADRSFLVVGTVNPAGPAPWDSGHAIVSASVPAAPVDYFQVSWSSGESFNAHLFEPSAVEAATFGPEWNQVARVSDFRWDAGTPFKSNVEISYDGATALAWFPQAWQQLSEEYAIQEIPSCVSPNVALEAMHDFVLSVVPNELFTAFSTTILSDRNFEDRIEKRVRVAISRALSKLTFIGQKLFLLPRFIGDVIGAVVRKNIFPIQSIFLARAHDPAQPGPSSFSISGRNAGKCKISHYNQSSKSAIALWQMVSLRSHHTFGTAFIPQAASSN